MALTLVIPKLHEAQIDGLVAEFCGGYFNFKYDIEVARTYPPKWLAVLILNNNKES